MRIAHGFAENQLEAVGGARAKEPSIHEVEREQPSIGIHAAMQESGVGLESSCAPPCSFSSTRVRDERIER
jgi:hypothetical protein